MKKLLFSTLSVFLLFVACSKEEQAPPPPPTPTYTLSFSAEAGGSVSSEGGTYTQGSKITVTATPDAQYLFKEWSDGSTTNPREITVTSNLTLKASFIKKTYPLAVTIEGEGTVQEEVIIQGSTSETEYNAGTTVRLTATPNEGWVFARWSGDIESEELEIEVPIEKGTAVSALFKRDSFELNITIEGEGTVKEEVIVQPGQYDYETVVRLTAIPGEGQKFTGWSGDVVSEENPVEVELKESIELTASFEKLFQTFYNATPFKPEFLEFGDFPNAALAADLNNDGNEEIIFSYANPVTHSSSSLIKKRPIVVLSFDNGKLNDVTSQYFSSIPETYFTRQILYEDLNGDGLKDLYFANHGAEPGDTSGDYPRTNGIWAEQDLVFFRTENGFINGNYPESIDYSHGAGIIRFAKGKIGIMRNEVSGKPHSLGGKNSIVYFEDGQWKIDTTLALIESEQGLEWLDDCSNSFWVYPIDLNGDGIDEVVGATNIYSNNNGEVSTTPLDISYAFSNGYKLNEGGFVFDIDNDGDLDLVKSNTYSINCTPTDGLLLSIFENINGDLVNQDLPVHSDLTFPNSIAPFDLNFDGLPDIVRFGLATEDGKDPNMVFINNGDSYELKEINTDQFDANVSYNGEIISIQQFSQFHYNYFLRRNEAYVFIVGTFDAMMAFEVTKNDLEFFFK